VADIDLVVTDEQRALGETLREFFAEQAPLERLHRPRGGEGFDRKTWAGVAELGLPAMIVPEEHGGLGQTANEAWVMFTEAGRGLYGGPLLAGVAATHALLLSGDDDACATHLPGVADGSTVATVAAAEAGSDGRWSAPAGGTTAERDGESWVLTGTKTLVLAGDAADLVLVAAATPEGPGLFAVTGDPEGLTRTELETLDLSRPLSRLHFDGVPARIVGAAGDGMRILEPTFDRLLVALAAEQAGGARACLDLSVEYARTRTQFDAPIGSFQAVAHLCVDMLARAERAEAASHYAAAAQAVGDGEFPVAARVAAGYCGRAFREVTTQTIHVHGGTGFTWEHDAHLFHRRAWSSEHLFGTASTHHAEVATRLGL
jgi:alkylation response protein AidB-like acyl-CoA dehydrogenase